MVLQDIKQIETVVSLLDKVIVVCNSYGIGGRVNILVWQPNLEGPERLHRA